MSGIYEQTSGPGDKVGEQAYMESSAGEKDSLPSHRVAQGKHVDGDVKLLDSQNQVRKVPIPSDTPRDPLNWSTTRKSIIVVTCCWFSIMSLALVGNAGPLIPYWMAAYAPPLELISPTSIINLSTWPSLFTGVGNFIFMPLALLAGRRFSILLASVCCLAAAIGAGGSQSFAGHMTARIFQGLSSGVAESLLPLVLTDITFVHNRARIFAVYWTSQSILSSIFGISGSYIAAADSWRAYYWVFAGTCGFGLLLNFFALPETRFNRPPANIDGQLVVTDAYGEQIVIDEASAGDVQTPVDSTNMTPLTFRETLKVWNGISPNGVHLALWSYVEMAKCFTSPGMLWTVAYSGITLGINIAFSLNLATVLITKYGWAESQTGLYQIAVIPAGLLATAYSGWAMDKLAIRSAKRNNGVHTPESRLPIIILPSILMLIGTVCYGYAVDQPEKFGHHWIAPIFFFAMMVFGFISSLITATTFGVECCSKAPGPALVIATGAKNLVAFGLSYGLTHIVFTKSGVYAFTTVLASTLAAVSVLGIPVYYYNPIWRKKASGHMGN